MKARKILTIVLSLAMLVGICSFSVFADGKVAKVGNTEYDTIDEAIANWTNGTTLTLLSDVTLSDVITLKSTEHHILNLGTYTMTAASGKNAIVIKACGTGSAERSAITINADAANPGGINAGSKCVVYYKYADGGISTEDRPIIKINGGVFTGSTSGWGTAGIYTIGTAARKCATTNIAGGTFNCTINGSGKSKLLISGGTFNYSVGSQGDSTANRLISGGTFKTIGFMTADSNNTKFWIGTSMGNSNVGVHVDDNGYIVVGGPVVTEAGTTFEASSANYSGASSYLQYSSAVDNGLYYTSVEEALADNNKASGEVTVYVDELDMTGISYKGTIVVPEGETITITTAEGVTPTWTISADEDAVTYVDTEGNELVKGEDGSFAPVPVEPAVKVDGAEVDVQPVDGSDNSYNITLKDGNSWTEDSSVTMTFRATGDSAYVVHNHNGTNYIYVGSVVDGTITINNTVGFSTFTVHEGGLDAALEAAKAMTGDVVVEIYDKVTLKTSLSGSYSTITFVGKDTDAEIYLDVQGYITATGKKVAFENLTLSKSEGNFITNAGFMNVAFGVYDVTEVAYTNCTFANGAYASSGKVTYTNCTFKRSWDKYGLWAYGNVDVTVDGCTFDDYRGIKMYAEGAAKTVDLTVKNTDFSAVTDKPAIVLTYGESVALENNTYSSTGVFELDLDGAPNGTAVTSDVAPTCKNDNGVCGVLVDGKIYTTVAQASEVATEGSTVTLLHNSTETVELAEGVTLNKNGFTADGVTVKVPVPQGNNFTGYTRSDAIWGEVWGNAKESFVIKVLDANGNVMGTTSLNNIGGIINGDVTATWNIKLDAASNTDEYWTMEWTTAPTIDNMPKKVELWVDGEKVSGGDVVLNAPDNLKKIYAAEVDADGKITGYCTLDTFVSKIGDLKDRRILVLRDVSFSSTEIRCVEFISGVEGGVTVTNTDVDNWIDFDFVTIGKGVTVNVENPYSGDSENVIEGTLNVGETYYHGYDAKTTIQNGGKVTVTGTTILRYNKNADSGIYIYGDGDDSTVEFDCDYYIGAYSGTFYVKDANVETGYFLLKNSYDNSSYANIDMTLDNSSLAVVGTTDTQDSFIIDDQASLTLTNGSSIEDVRDFSILAGTNLTLSVDETSSISATNMTIAEDVPFEATENADGTFGVAKKEGLSGSGTEEDPYLINNQEELLWFQAKVDEQAADGSTQFAGKYFKLTADIDLAGINWNPIGSMSGDHGSFKGVFDGDGHTIFNLNVQQAGNGLGLFARTAGNAEIKNLTLNNVTVKSTDNSNYVGGLVGNSYASTKITNVHVTGTIDISGRGYIGGISGHGYVVMEDVTVVGTGTISSTFWCAGGILGYGGEGATNIKNAHVEGITITSAAGGLGAIVGMAEDNNGTQPISGSNLSAKNVEIKTYTGAYGDAYANYALGYLYGGNPTSKLTGTLTVENVEIETSSGEAPAVNDAVAQIGNAIYFDLQSALDAAAAGTGNVTVEILKDVNLTGIDWNPVTVSASGYPVVTVNGNNKIITGLNDMLFAGTWAGKSGLIINDLTIANSNIVNDENDAMGTVGVGAFIGFPQASETITLNNCHLKNSTVKGGHWTGGLIGYAAGYAGNDGPVFMNLTIKNCSVTDSTITGKGSAGGVIGHGSGNGWTKVVIEDTAVSGNTITSTGSSTNKAGAVMGTIGAAGQPTTVNGVTLTGGASIAAAVSGNTVTSAGTTITTIYGRQGTETGMLYVTGGSYDKYPIEENVTYAAPMEGYEIVENDDGTYGVVVDSTSGKVAKIGDTYYATLADALDAVQNEETITLLNVEGSEINNEIEFTKNIEFTITGTAPEYALPIVTFQNATVNIKDATILIPELDARQNATINVIDSIVYDAGGNSIVKSYYNGAINISGASNVYAMQVTTMGYITISGSAKLTATWQTNVYGNGLITVNDDATFNTAALHLTGQDYSSRDNTDADRVGEPAQITVDNATLIVGKAFSVNGTDYSYNSSHGINIGTIDGKQAVLDIVNGATVNIYMANGETANIGADGTVNVDGTLTVGCRAANGTATLVNNGSIVLTDATSVVTANECGNVTTDVEGYEVTYADGKYTLVAEVEETVTPFKGGLIFIGNVDVDYDENNNPSYPIFVATSVDSLNYQKVGFKYEISIKNPETEDFGEPIHTVESETKTVYESISDNNNTYTVKNVSEENGYLFMDKLSFQAGFTNDNTKIAITPYAIDLNGNKITGWTIEVTNDVYIAWQKASGMTEIHNMFKED